MVYNYAKINVPQLPGVGKGTIANVQSKFQKLDITEIKNSEIVSTAALKQTPQREKKGHRVCFFGSSVNGSYL